MMHFPRHNSSKFQWYFHSTVGCSGNVIKAKSSNVLVIEIILVFFYQKQCLFVNSGKNDIASVFPVSVNLNSHHVPVSQVLKYNSGLSPKAMIKEK